MGERLGVVVDEVLRQRLEDDQLREVVDGRPLQQRVVDVVLRLLLAEHEVGDLERLA